MYLQTLFFRKLRVVFPGMKILCDQISYQIAYKLVNIEEKRTRNYVAHASEWTPWKLPKMRQKTKPKFMLIIVYLAKVTTRA